MDGQTDRAELEATPAGVGPLLPAGGSEVRPLRLQVFEQVRAAGRAARADVTRALGVSPGSVTQATADLISAGYLREVEAPVREAGRGRPPVALEVVAEAGLVAGIKLADVQHSAVLADFAGNVLAEAALEVPPQRRSLAELGAEFDRLMDQLLDAAGIEVSALSAIGIGIPGLIEAQSGHVVWSPLLDETAVDLAAALADRVGLPVHLENDVNLLTLAELWFGAGRALSDFAVVTIEEGVGMGLVAGNRLYRGAHGLGMELGHTKVQLDGALCRCGRRGCLEAYIADYALVREAATALGRPFQYLQSPGATLEALFAQAKAGHVAARTIFQRAGRYLALGLANVAELFDPGRIILSGARMRYDFLYGDDVLAEMAGMTLARGRAAPVVEAHAWGDLVWARGASALALDAETQRRLGAEWASA